MSFLSALVLAATVEGQVRSLINKKKNRLMFTVTDARLGDTKTYVANWDITKSWAFESSVTLTENPVEQGVVINDHRIIKPEKLTIEVGASNVVNPLNINKYSLQTPQLLFLGTRGVAETPIQVTNQMLKLSLYNGDTFNIETPLGTYRDYLIISIKSKNDNTNFGAFEGTLEMQEVLTFDSTKVVNSTVSGLNDRPRVNNLTLTGN